jgi:hypothetical protein
MVTKQKALDFPINSWVVFTKDLSELNIKKNTTGIVCADYCKHYFLIKVSIQREIGWSISYWVPKDSIALTPSYLEKVKRDIGYLRTYAQNDALYIACNIGAIKECIDSDEKPDWNLLFDFKHRCQSLLEKLDELSYKKMLLASKKGS